jgi:hypothetical protein
MTAGIPGAGIGGLFYLANALLLPVRTLVRRARGEQVAWRPALSQAALAAGVLLGIWIAGWLLGLWIGPIGHSAARHGALSTSTAVHTARLLGVTTLFMSAGTLGLVLLSVQLARWVVRRSPSR